jgi:hypothetical protein
MQGTAPQHETIRVGDIARIFNETARAFATWIARMASLAAFRRDGFSAGAWHMPCSLLVSRRSVTALPCSTHRPFSGKRPRGGSTAWSSRPWRLGQRGLSAPGISSRVHSPGARHMPGVPRPRLTSAPSAPGTGSIPACELASETSCAGSWPRVVTRRRRRTKPACCSVFLLEAGRHPRGWAIGREPPEGRRPSRPELPRRPLLRSALAGRPVARMGRRRARPPQRARRADRRSRAPDRGRVTGSSTGSANPAPLQRQ